MERPCYLTMRLVLRDGADRASPGVPPYDEGNRNRRRSCDQTSATDQGDALWFLRRRERTSNGRDETRQTGCARKPPGSRVYSLNWSPSRSPKLTVRLS
jgi:hypothetical protein